MIDKEIILRDHEITIDQYESLSDDEKGKYRADCIMSSKAKVIQHIYSLKLKHRN